MEELLVEVAKWHYRNENPQRKRIPKGFADEFSLKVTEIGDGSAIPKIVLCFPTVTGTLFPVDHRENYCKSERVDRDRDRPHTAPASVAWDLQDSHLAYFDRIGRSLRDGEVLELNYPDASVRANQPGDSSLLNAGGVLGSRLYRGSHAAGKCYVSGRSAKGPIPVATDRRTGH